MGPSACIAQSVNSPSTKKLSQNDSVKMKL